MRRKAKVANYGIIYGISASKLAADIGIKRENAEEFIQSYFEALPGVKLYIESIVEEARRNGYVTTIMNRRRYIPDIDSPNFGVRRFSERTAINTPIQGSAADLIKMAMIQIDERIARLGLRSVMILQVHDELVFETPRDEVEQTSKWNRWSKKSWKRLIRLTCRSSPTCAPAAAGWRRMTERRSQINAKEGASLS
jgi:DNA polymerase-1